MRAWQSLQNPGAISLGTSSLQGSVEEAARTQRELDQDPEGAEDAAGGKNPS